MTEIRIVRKIVKSGSKYVITLPVKHNDLWRNLHDKYVIVEIRTIEEK